MSARSVTADTCAPPPAHADKEWHWLRHVDGADEVMRWDVRNYWERAGMTAHREPHEIAARGWRYLEPCKLPAIPPTEGEGG